MPLQWMLKPAEQNKVETLAESAGYLPAIARILVQRGLTDEAGIDAFLNPQLAGLMDPYLLPDMEKAVERIWASILRDEPMVVFGDYDVDGVTSSALLSRILSEIGAQVFAFIPDRLDEGYGLSFDALDRCLMQHPSTLVITVDCGTNAVETVAAAKEKGIDIIVTDHHEPDEQTADAFALVNPKVGTNEELKILAGVGVAFKMAHALLKYGRAHDYPKAAAVDLKEWLDLAAFGTVADIVPLTGENRLVVRHGLSQLNATRWVGLRALKDVAGVRGDAETYHLGFQLGPRINAAGRIGQPMQALQLLITDDAAEAREIAALLNETNLDRRELEKTMADEAFAEIDAYFDPEQHFGLVVAREGWHPGVVGIVASRVSRHYNRPAIVMGIDAEEGSVRGSCRGIDCFDLLEGLQACEAHLIKFGGHKMAAGLSVKPDAVEAFKSDFNTVATAMLSKIDLSSTLAIDAILSADELDWKFMDSLRQMRPFGQDCPEPVLALCGVETVGSPRVVGNLHLKFTVFAHGKKIDAIAFNFPREALPAAPFDIAFTLKENEWNGKVSLQMQVKDVRPSAPLA